jgi:LysR family transcriptional regulator, cell division regulator
MIATPTELSHFIELFRTGHLTRAAIKLSITQPGLTQSLLSLERKMGSKLFFRTKQGMIPTADGKELYEQAQVLLDHWKLLENKFRVSREGLQGRFKLGAHQSVASYCLPKLLENLDKEAPKIELEIFHDFSRKITERIVGHELDLGFVVNPVRHPDLVLKQIGTDEVRFWVSKEVTEIPKRLICDLNSEQLDKTRKTEKGNPFEGWTFIQTPSLEVVRSVTLAGQAVGFFPKRVAMMSGSTLIPYKPKQFSVYKDAVFLAYRKDRLTSSAGKALLRCARIQLD